MMKNTIETALAEFKAFLESEQTEAKQIIDYLRTTPLPYIACYHKELSIAERFDLSFRFLHLLGKHNVALAVGLCMNQYMAFSISCLPVAEGSAIHVIKHQFLESVKQNRWILAVSSFDDFIRNKNEGSKAVQCVTQSNGNIVCNGVKNFQSNITEADVLLFSGVLDSNKTGLFYAFLKESNNITLGDAMYSGAMADTDTRSITFNDLTLLPTQMVPASDENEALGLHALTRVVFAVMAMAPYLGGAQRALEEACGFLNQVHMDDKPLSSFDGYITDMGRAKIKYQLCEDLIERFKHSVNTLDSVDFSAWLQSEGPKALSLKYHVTATCEELVNLSRKIIGTRAMMPSHIVSRLSQQILFAALHPVLNAKIERDLGKGILQCKQT